MNREIETFKVNVDAWIKQIRSEYSDILDLDLNVSENTENIQHNYELIHELREEMEDLKREMNLLKILQLISLKPHLKEKIKNQI